MRTSGASSLYQNTSGNFYVISCLVPNVNCLNFGQANELRKTVQHKVADNSFEFDFATKPTL